MQQMECITEGDRINFGKSTPTLPKNYKSSGKKESKATIEY